MLEAKCEKLETLVIIKNVENKMIQKKQNGKW